MTLEQLQAKRERLLESIGIAQVTYGDRSIQYARQREALELLDAEIQRAQSPEGRVFTIQTSRGL